MYLADFEHMYSQYPMEKPPKKCIGLYLQIVN